MDTFNESKMHGSSTLCSNEHSFEKIIGDNEDDIISHYLVEGTCN